MNISGPTGCLLIRPSVPRYTDTGYWQMFSINNQTVYTISAFYDDRPVLDVSVFIRILVVTSGFKEKEVTAYCHLWYKDELHPVIVPGTVTSSGRGHILHGVRNSQSLYTCPLKTTRKIPTHVSISLSPCQNSTIYQPIMIQDRKKWEMEFGLCVSIAFGTVPVQGFVEWMEFHRILGVSEVNIYDGAMKDMDPVFRYYYGLGILRIFSMPPPVAEFSVYGIKTSSPASLNDCMMRNMYRYRYIVVVDFDEVIVPKYHENYTSMLTDINKIQKQDYFAPSYTFRNQYHFNHFPTNDKYTLKTLRFLRHAKPNGFLFGSKSMIDPRRCESVFNHYCLVRFPQVQSFTVDVNTSIATSHHYRKCPFEHKKCEELSKEQSTDDGILRFKDRLTSRVDRVMDALKEAIK